MGRHLFLGVIPQTGRDRGMGMRTKLVAMGALAGALFLTSTSRAQSPSERENARRLMDEGDHYVEQQKLDKALTSYQAAHAIMHVPTTGIDVAVTLATLGRMIEAREVALEVTHMPGAGTESTIFAEARRDAAELADRLATKIPTLRIQLPDGVDPATVRATIDGQEVSDRALAVPKRLDPGKHAIRVEAPGYTPFVRELDLKEGARAIVPVELRNGDAVVGLPPLAFYGLVAAGAGVTLGSITGLVSLDKADGARKRCGADPKNCDPSAQSYIDSATTYGWISTISFGIALVGGAVATYALVTRSDPKSQRTIAIHATGTGALIKGTF